MSEEAKTEAAAELPTEVSELDALRLENLSMKVERAKAETERLAEAFNVALLDVSKRYQFDAAKDVVYFATRKIERR